MARLLTVISVLLVCSMFVEARYAPAAAYSCNTRYYTNSDGQLVHSPTCEDYSKNYTAICRDGSYSYSRHHRGTCSRHGGVKSWK